MKTFSDFLQTCIRLSEALMPGRDLEMPLIAAEAYEDPKTANLAPSDLDEEEIDEEEIEEDAPTNNMGGGAIANGNGVTPKKKLEVVGPPVIDPRMFRAKIFARKPPVKLPSGNLQRR